MKRQNAGARFIPGTAVLHACSLQQRPRWWRSWHSGDRPECGRATQRSEDQNRATWVNALICPLPPFHPLRSTSLAKIASPRLSPFRSRAMLSTPMRDRAGHRAESPFTLMLSVKGERFQQEPAALRTCSKRNPFTSFLSARSGS